MTHDELEQLLEGQDLLKTLDIKTLVLDLIRDMPAEALTEIFWGKMPELSADFVRDYLYMKRA